MGRARDRYSIADAGFVAGGKESKEGRQTIFFTPLDPCHSDASEAAVSMDVSNPRKVHYQTHWRPEQDAVYWVNLSRAQDCGLKFWQTQSHVIIVYHSLPKERVEKVVTEQGGRQLFSRQLTFRPGPKVTLKNSWVKSDSSTSDLLRETDACDVVMTNKNSNSRESRIGPGQNSDRESTASIEPVAGNRVLDNDETVLQIDLRVNGIPSDEIYDDKQKMQSITKQKKKTCSYGEKSTRRTT